MSSQRPLAGDRQSEDARLGEQQSEEARYRRYLCIAKHWPGFLISSGFLIFALACINSDKLPTAALFVGPGMMVTGVILKEQNRRDPPPGRRSR
jgi:hypothetical protein